MSKNSKKLCKVWSRALSRHAVIVSPCTRIVLCSIVWNMQTSYFVILLPKCCSSVKSRPCISFLIASVCVLSSEQLGIIKCFGELAAKPPVKFFSFILTSLHVVIFLGVFLDSLQASCGTSVYVQYSGSTPNKIYIYFAIKGISLSFEKPILLCWFRSKNISLWMKSRTQQFHCLILTRREKHFTALRDHYSVRVMHL